MRIFFLILLICVCKSNVSFSQYNDSNFNLDTLLIPENAEIILFGEDHYKDNRHLYLEVIKHYLKNGQKINIGFEYPRIYEIYFKDYIKNGNNEALKRIEWINAINKKDHLLLLKSIREQINPDILNKYVNIFCFDAQHVYEGKLFTFHEIEKALIHLNDERLNSLRSIIRNYEKTSDFETTINTLLDKLKSDSLFYESFLHDNYTVLFESLESLSLTYNFGTSKLNNKNFMLIREKWIAEVINKQSESIENTKTLVFTGAAHISLLEIDSLNLFSPQTSVNYLIKNTFSRNTFAVLLLYKNTRFNLIDMISFDYSDLLSHEDETKLKASRSQDFIFVENSQLGNSKELQERFDAIIILTKKKKRR